MSGSLNKAGGRIVAIVLRQWRLFSGSWPRVVDLAYWPTVQILLWGFLQVHVFREAGPGAVTLSTLLGAILLWDIAWRGQLSLSLSFFEEIWSRNLGHLLVSPLRPTELIAGLMVVSVIKTMTAMIPAVAIAALAFDFNLFALGPALYVFILALVLFAWSISLAAMGLVVRFGQGAQEMPWAIMFGFAPFCAIYYPLDVLPEIFQWVGSVLPPAYIFEGMRAVVVDGVADMRLVGIALALDVVWLAAGCWAFFALLGSARRRGMLLQIGE
jgi:ABC-2 type transport system permease protein